MGEVYRARDTRLDRPRREAAASIGLVSNWPALLKK
jgi:hypothetical protein